jgi:hypothetical protein
LVLVSVAESRPRRCMHRSTAFGRYRGFGWPTGAWVRSAEFWWNRLAFTFRDSSVKSFLRILYLFAFIVGAIVLRWSWESIAPITVLSVLGFLCLLLGPLVSLAPFSASFPSDGRRIIEIGTDAIWDHWGAEGSGTGIRSRLRYS